MHETLNILPNRLIMRELLPPPISSCDVRSLRLVKQFFALSSMVFAHAGKAFLCLYLCAFSLFFMSCEGYEDPSHTLLEGYFHESEGLKQASNDSIRCFSEKVDAFTKCTPSAKNDPLYTKIQENIRGAMLQLQLNIEDDWGEDIYIHF